MKFVSKNQNLRIVLKPGIPGNPALGQPIISGLYVKFENGVANISDEKMIELMTSHPGFNSDFIKIEDSEIDPYVRKNIEPDHKIMDMDHGAMGKEINPKKIVLPPEVKAEISRVAVEMAKEMAPKMALEILRKIAKGSKGSKASKVEKSEEVEEELTKEQAQVTE